MRAILFEAISSVNFTCGGGVWESTYARIVLSKILHPARKRMYTRLMLLKSHQMQLHTHVYLIAAAGLLVLLVSVPVHGADYYVATSGNDNGEGTLAHPFASIARAQQAASSGDTVYVRGGTYTNFAVAATDANYQYVINITKSNIHYLAYPGDSRPVLDFSNISPSSLRVCGIRVTGSNNTFHGIDLTGI